MVYCPECKCDFSNDPSEETSIDDHGICVACHKAWQMGEGELMRVLEFRHVGPFDGCFWRHEYIAITDEGEVLPIVFTPGHLMAHEVVDLTKGCFVPADYPFFLHANLFKDFTWYGWDRDLFDEIPYGYFPAFWKSAEEMGLTFTWFCGECGELQADEPIHMAGYHGNGGVGIEVEGWLCKDCATEQEARYYESEDK